MSIVGRPGCCSFARDLIKSFPSLLRNALMLLYEWRIHSTLCRVFVFSYSICLLRIFVLLPIQSLTETILDIYKWKHIVRTLVKLFPNEPFCVRLGLGQKTSTKVWEFSRWKKTFIPLTLFLFCVFSIYPLVLSRSFA